MNLFHCVQVVVTCSETSVMQVLVIHLQKLWSSLSIKPFILKPKNFWNFLRLFSGKCTC